MIVDRLPIGLISTNCYLVTCSETGEALIVDPGWPDPVLEKTIDSRDAKVKMIVNTHAHFDHILGNAYSKELTGAPLVIHEEALPMLKAGGGARNYGIPFTDSPEPDRYLQAGELFRVGEMQFKVLFTPGHAPGHISLYSENHSVVFDGDVLFNRGIGRTDLAGGNFDVLMSSIRQELLSLPDETVVLCGHGPPTTIGEERTQNPWIQDQLA